MPDLQNQKARSANILTQQSLKNHFPFNFMFTKNSLQFILAESFLIFGSVFSACYAGCESKREIKYEDYYSLPEGNGHYSQDYADRKNNILVGLTASAFLGFSAAALEKARREIRNIEKETPKS